MPKVGQPFIKPTKVARDITESEYYKNPLGWQRLANESDAPVDVYDVNGDHCFTIVPKKGG